MHPELQRIAHALSASGHAPILAWRFGLACVEDVAANLESEEVIAVLQALRRCAAEGGPGNPSELQDLATRMTHLASSHPGSKSIDGTRHAAVSATYALAHAVHGRAVQAAAYAAYSAVYGYGGYAVSDPDCFAEIHRRQWDHLQALQRAPELRPMGDSP